MEGKQVPQELVTKVGEVFEIILEEASYFFLFNANTVIFWFIVLFCSPLLLHKSLIGGSHFLDQRNVMPPLFSFVLNYRNKLRLS